MKNIAIVAGGYSSEYIVSLKSAEGIYSFLDQTKYRAFVVVLTRDEWRVQLPHSGTTSVDKNNFSFVWNNEKIRFDFAYITIHGTPGEDGKLQGYLDMLHIPYSNSSTLVSALTFNKYTCNQYLSHFGVKVAPSIRLFKDQAISTEEVLSQLGLPVFIKPNDGGSSFGTTKVKDAADIQPAIAAAFAEGEEVIIEAFMSGTELTCGCYKNTEGMVVLPVTEVVSKNEFFDFEAKYTADKVEEITPARISTQNTKAIQELSAHIYTLLGAKGIIRVDYILSEQDEIKLLEVNTTPGMTATSFIPQQVQAAGLSMKEVLTSIIENECN